VQVAGQMATIANSDQCQTVDIIEETGNGKRSLKLAMCQLSSRDLAPTDLSPAEARKRQHKIIGWAILQYVQVGGWTRAGHKGDPFD
jgi:hypothetical protein